MEEMDEGIYKFDSVTKFEYGCGCEIILNNQDQELWCKEKCNNNNSIINLI